MPATEEADELGGGQAGSLGVLGNVLPMCIVPAIFYGEEWWQEKPPWFWSVLLATENAGHSCGDWWWLYQLTNDRCGSLLTCISFMRSVRHARFSWLRLRSRTTLSAIEDV